MQIETSRFGKIDIAEESIVEFRSGLPGFPNYKSFTLIAHSKSENFVWLQSLQDPDLAFLLVDPVVYVPDYCPDLPSGWEQDLEAEPNENIALLCISRIPSGKPLDATINLAAPIIINADKRVGAQVILESDEFPIRRPLFADQTKAA